MESAGMRTEVLAVQVLKIFKTAGVYLQRGYAGIQPPRVFTSY